MASEQHLNVEGAVSLRQPVIMLGDGREVRCAMCRTDSWGLSKGQEADDHMSPRFENVLQPGMNEVWRWSVTLDGVQVVDQTFEARPGDKDTGYVITYVTVEDPLTHEARRRPCAQSVEDYGVEGAHPLIEKRRGVVTVEKVPVPVPGLDAIHNEAVARDVGEIG